MTNEDATPDVEQSQEMTDYLARRRRAQPDMVLAALVQVAEDSGLEVGVTLTVSGAVVSGTLVGRREWANRAIVKYDQLQDVLGPFKAGWDEQALADAERTGDEDMPPYHTVIHLTEARHFIGDRLIPDGGAFWRGRLSEVSGWSFGVFGS